MASEPADRSMVFNFEGESDQHEDSGTGSNEVFGATVPAAAGQGVSSGIVSVVLHHNREYRREEHQQVLLLGGGDKNKYPFIPLHKLKFEDASGGTSEKATKKRSRAPVGTKKKKAPHAPAARRKRKPAEDPKTYVPLAITSRKEHDYYWHHF